MLDSERNVINYTMKTGIGFSGSPILAKTENFDYKVVGIHTHKGVQKGFNSGLFFGKNIRNTLKLWVREAEREWGFSKINVFYEEPQKLKPHLDCQTETSEIDQS
mgnify:CR=1 FL=1